MVQVNIHEAKTTLSKLLQKAVEGEEVVIAKNNKPIAKLVPVDGEKKKRVPGSAKGKVLWIADDFNETPDDFKDYM